MKMYNLIILMTVFGLCIGFSFINPTYAQLQNLEDVDVTVTSITKINLEKTDVLILNVSFINDGNSASSILANTIFLVDSKQREFASTSYLQLKEKNHDVSSKECPLLFTIDVNPGITENVNLCYEIQKDIDSKYSLKLYESTPEICAEPIFDCTIKIFPIVVSDNNSQKSSLPKIPDWVKNTMQWYLDGSISENEMISAIQFLVKEGIIKLN